MIMFVDHWDGGLGVGTGAEVHLQSVGSEQRPEVGLSLDDTS